MKKRIKFIYDTDETKSQGKNRHNSTIGVSKDYFKINNKHIKVFIHLKEFYFEFITDNGEVIYRGGKASNTEVLLRQVKRELQKQGCNFGKETRSKHKNE